MIDGKPIEILLVEDNPGDCRLALEVLKDAKVKNKLHIATDGEQALQFLRNEGDYADVPRPDLILLDLNLPKIDGREVLKEIKLDENLRRIPVVILTVSSADEDIFKTYDLHANAYIVKPINLNQFIDVVKVIENFWLSIVKLPPNGESK